MTQKSQSATSIALLADFNIQNLGVLLKKNASFPEVECELAPYGQTVNLLLDEQSELWSNHYDSVLVWTLPERAVPTFQRVISFEDFSLNDLLAEVDAFVATVRNVPHSVSSVLLPSWFAPGIGRGWGPLDLSSRLGIANVLMRMNLRLAEQCECDRRIVVLDTQKWITAAGSTAYSPKLWYLSKTPFSSSVFQHASHDILSGLQGMLGRSKKVAILDLDNTLWGGVVGEVGYENLRLGGHDPLGEAFVDFQRGLKRLVNRGILLGIVSKNEETLALEAIRRHPEMILRLEDFAGWIINWQDKAKNINDLLGKLNLSLDSAVFLDDSPFERARVSEALPQVLVPELPADPIQYASFLADLRCFDNPLVTQEDRARTGMYVADRQRIALKTEVRSLGDWLENLQIQVVAELLNDANLERAAQLLNKTNQMNLTTRRLSATELLNWSSTPGHYLWTFRVSDRFGNYGLCGIASLVHESTRGRLLDFVLSCRVIGRGVEDTMLCTAAQHSRKLGCEQLYAEYIPSPKNQPCLQWLQSQPKLVKNQNCFQMQLVERLDPPQHVRSFMDSNDEKIQAAPSI